MGSASVSMNRGCFAKLSDTLERRSNNKAAIQGIKANLKTFIQGLKKTQQLTLEKTNGFFEQKEGCNTDPSETQARLNAQHDAIKKIVKGLKGGEVTIANDQCEAVLHKLLQISGKNLDGLSANIRLPRPQHYTKTLFAAGRLLLLGITSGVCEAAGIIDVHVPGNPLPGNLAGHEAGVHNAQERLDASQAKLDGIVDENQKLYSFGSNEDAENLRQSIQNQLNSPVNIGGQDYPNLIEYAKTWYREDSDIVKSLENLNANIDPKVLGFHDLNEASKFLNEFHNQRAWSEVYSNPFEILTADVDKLTPYVKIPPQDLQHQVGLRLTRVIDPSDSPYFDPSRSYDYIKFLDKAENTQVNFNVNAANLHATQESLANFKNTVHYAAVGTTAAVVALEAASAVNALTTAGKAANPPGAAANAAATESADAPTAQSKVKRNWLGKTLDFKAKWVGALGIVGYLRQLPNICTALRSRQTSAHEYHGRLLLLCKQKNVKVEEGSKNFVTNAGGKTGVGGFFIRRIAGQFAKDWVNSTAPAVQSSAEPSSSVSSPAPKNENNFKDILIKTGHYYTAKTKQDATANDLTPVQKLSMGMKAIHAGIKFGLLQPTNFIGLLPGLSTIGHMFTTKEPWANTKNHFIKTRNALNGRADELKAKASNLSM